MSKKSYCKNIKEVDDVLRALSSGSVPDVQLLQKLFLLLRKHPVAFGNHVGRVESSLLSIINTTKSSCDLQRSVHPHYSHHDAAANKVIRVAATCFSLLPTLTVAGRKNDRFLDFQLKLVYALCDSYSALLRILGFSHVNLLSLNTYISSKCKHFSSLGCALKDEMPSPEYVQLIYARIDFFTASLRSIFESKTIVECSFHLPLLIALFTAILSVELTANGKTSNLLLLRSSQLLHCLACVCQSVSVKLMPASVSLLTLIVYQLEWTSDWRKESKLTEGLVRHRLASLRCLQTLVSGTIEFSSNRLLALLPRILGQMVQDLIYCTNTSELTGNPDVSECDMKEMTLTSPIALHKRRMLVATLNLAGQLLKTPENFTQPSEPLIVEIGRLQLCLMHVVRQLISGFPGGPPFRRLRPNYLPVSHPAVLNSLLKTTCALCAVSNSMHFRDLIAILVHELKNHPDPQVRSVAHQQQLLLIGPTYSRPTLSIPEQTTQDEQKSKSDNNSVLVDVVEDRIEPVVADLVYVPEEETAIVEAVQETGPDARSPKRRRTDDSCKSPTAPTEERDDQKHASVSLTLDACLSSFDPTFI